MVALPKTTLGSVRMQLSMKLSLVWSQRTGIFAVVVVVLNFLSLGSEVVVDVVDKVGICEGRSSEVAGEE